MEREKGGKGGKLDAKYAMRCDATRTAELRLNKAALGARQGRRKLFDSDPDRKSSTHSGTFPNIHPTHNVVAALFSIYPTSQKEGC